MRDTGLFFKWEKKHFVRSKCDGKKYKSSPTLFSNIWLLMAITAGCLGVCIVVFSLELLMSRTEILQTKPQALPTHQVAAQSFSIPLNLAGAVDIRREGMKKGNVN